jgi:hypothetical protein
MSFICCYFGWLGFDTATYKLQNLVEIFNKVMTRPAHHEFQRP